MKTPSKPVANKKTGGKTTQSDKKQNEKQERLAEKLKANLRRRKAPSNPS